MNENSTNNNNKHAQYPVTPDKAFKKQYPDETGYSVPGTYTDPEWEAYLEWNKNPSVPLPDEVTEITTQERIDKKEMSWDIPKGTKHTPEYYRKEGKPEWNLVDFPSLEPLVRALEYGKSKHGKFSYRNFIPKDVLIDKLYRHLIEIHKGNFVDEETGEHHIGGVLANAMFYSYHHRVNDILNIKVEDTKLIDILSDQQKLINILGYNLAKEQALKIECTEANGFIVDLAQMKPKETQKEFMNRVVTQCCHDLIDSGLTREEVAKKLGISTRTVYRRLKNGN